MQTSADPILTTWYKDLDTQETFRVIAVDELNDAIEVQYLDGGIAEIDATSWYESPFDPIEAPEDWSTAYGDPEVDDLGYTDPDVHQPRKEEIDIAALLDD